MLIGAAVVVVAYGAGWLSVRHQHPYSGPSGMAAKENWRWLGFSLGAVAVGAIGSFAGPAGVWAVVGIGLCVLLLARPATQIWPRRA